MKLLFSVAALLAAGALLAAQEERKVPNDSARITIPGCADGRTFIIAAREGHESVSAELRPGRRFRLSGPKDILKDIEAREGSMVEVTGLVRKADLAGPGGISAAGGRIRIGGGSPQAGIGTDPSRGRVGGTLDAVLDIEGWRPLLEPCR